jgi:hypothetical protein
MLFDRSVVVGAGVRLTSLGVTSEQGQQQLFTTTGAGVELGALWTPHALPFRAGASFRGPVTTEVDPNSRIPVLPGGDRVVGDVTSAGALYLPERVTQPWDLNVGIALGIGPRRLNPRWIDPTDRSEPVEQAQAARAEARRRASDDMSARGRAADAENQLEDALDELGREHLEDETRTALKRRYRSLPRQYVLISMSMILVGAVDDAVGVEGFHGRRVTRAGQTVTVSPRLGIETELVPNWMKVRAGTYGEPTRFDTGRNRLHATLGFDTKLFGWTVFGAFEEDTEWRFGAALVAANRYLGWGLSLGVWH